MAVLVKFANCIYRRIKNNIDDRAMGSKFRQSAATARMDSIRKCWRKFRADLIQKIGGEYDGSI